MRTSRESAAASRWGRIAAPIALAVLVLLPAPMLIAGETAPQSAPDNYIIWQWGADADIDSAKLPHIAPADRIGAAGSDGNEAYRSVKGGVFQVLFTLPAFDFNPNAYGSINHPFYLTIRFKDVAKQGTPVATGKGGCGFYGAGTIGSFGGAGDGQWKEETLIVPRSMLRCTDGKTFQLKLTEPPADVPVASLTLFSAATKLPGAKAKIAAAHQADAAKRSALRQNLLPKFKDLGLPNPGPCPEYTTVEKSRGFRIFFPPVSRQLFANSQPQPGELVEDLHLYACNGQPVTIVAAVRGLKKLGNISVKWITPLETPAEADTTDPYGAEAARYRGIRWATYSEQRIGSSWGADYRVCPEQLVLGASQPVGADRLEIMQLSFVPRGLPPKDYHGALLFIADDGGTYTVPVILTVYPFELERPTHSTHGQFYYVSYGNVNPYELQDMADHGMDMVVSELGAPVAPKPDGTRDTAGPRAAFKLLKQLGYRAPLVSSNSYLNNLTKDLKNRDTYNAVIAETLQIAKEEGFDELGFFPVDEPHTPPLQELAKAACTWIRNTPAANTFITSNPKAVPVLDDVLNYVCYNLSYITDQTLAGMKPHQKLMFYCPSIDVNPEYNRYRPGYYMYKLGAHSSQYFAYMEFAGDPWCDLDSDHRDWNVVYPSMNCILPDPTLAWEAMREGVYDYRFLYTLQRWIDKARAAGNAAAADAGAQVLTAVLAPVNLDGTKAGGPAIAIEANVALKDEKVDEAQLQANPALAQAAWYDQSRRKVAEAIMALQQALK